MVSLMGGDLHVEERVKSLGEYWYQYSMILLTRDASCIWWS